MSYPSAEKRPTSEAQVWDRSRKRRICNGLAGIALLGWPHGTTVPFATFCLAFNVTGEQFWGRAARAPRSQKRSRRSLFGAEFCQILGSTRAHILPIRHFLPGLLCARLSQRTLTLRAELRAANSAKRSIGVPRFFLDGGAEWGHNRQTWLDGAIVLPVPWPWSKASIASPHPCNRIFLKRTLGR
jgi:hypothetical protein